MKTRIEKDNLGEMDIPENVYWGIHTARALHNFNLSAYKVSPAFIKALAMVKMACCLANYELKYLDKRIADSMLTACEEIINGDLADQFQVDALQGGAGTSTNMNMNEVIANRALEILGYEMGQYEIVNPIGHCNLHQSTNDVYPTALKIASIFQIRKLSEVIAGLQGALQKKEQQFSDILCVGRTEMQDAVPITLGGQFSSFAEAIARDRWRTFKCEERLRTVNIGGTAVGTGLTAPREYIFMVIEKLREISGLGLTRADTPLDQTANADVFVEVAGILNAHGTNLVKIASDLRLLHFLGEINLPAVQTGSSIMPGKVNPVIAEATITVGLKVAANTGLIADCASRGTLQINEFLPLIAFTMLETLELLINTNVMLEKHILRIEANAEICRLNFEKDEMLITAFLPEIGYEKAEEIVNSFQTNGNKNFREYLVDKLGAELVKRILSPGNLKSLGFK